MKVGCRYYDPQVGSFTTRDTYLDQKPYLYCEHDPVNGVDPTGHDEDFWGGAEDWATIGLWGAGVLKTILFPDPFTLNSTVVATFPAGRALIRRVWGPIERPIA